jgi:hypothetical protein
MGIRIATTKKEPKGKRFVKNKRRKRDKDWRKKKGKLMMISYARIAVFREDKKTKKNS